MRTAVTTPPSSEPVTVSEAQAHCRAEGRDDVLFESLVRAARRRVELGCERSLITQTRTLTLDYREAIPPIVLPYGPVISVTGFEVWDTDTAAYTTVPTTAYTVSGDRITLSEADNSTTWPTAERVYDSFKITYTAGYGTANDVPVDLKQAILLYVADMYENRETMVIGHTASPVLNIDDLIAPYVNYQCG